MHALQSILEHHWILWLWIAALLLCEWALLHDLWRENPQVHGVMRLVWVLTVVYSGPLGLWLYWVCGRRQIPADSIWRRGGRSVAHCYSGCGIGEIAGVVITAGLLSLGNWWVAGVTFGLAYVAGFALTVAPLIQEGVSFHQAMLDAFSSETASITVMEITAIGVDLWLGTNAAMGEPRFWTSMIISLTCGLVAAYPVNVLLIHLGVKEGMHDPRQMATPS